MKRIISLIIAVVMLTAGRMAAQSVMDSINRREADRAASLNSQALQNQLYGIQQSQEATARAIQQQTQQQALQRSPGGSVIIVPNITPAPIVTGEATDEMAERHRLVRAYVDQCVSEAYAKAHPFAPTGSQPATPAAYYDEAIRASDAQAASNMVAALRQAEQKPKRETVAAPPIQEEPPPVQAFQFIHSFTLPLPELTLKTGVVLKNATIRNYNQTSGKVLIMYGKSALTQPLANLPDDIATSIRQLVGER